MCCAALSSKLHVGSISAFTAQGSVVSELDNNKVKHFSYVYHYIVLSMLFNKPVNS